MAQYMLLVTDSVEGYSRYTKSEISELIDKMHGWTARLRKAGVHRGGEKLTDEPGKVLRTKDGKVVLDGPFAEAKELIGGFLVVEARDESEAIEMAKECPALSYASRIEVRKVAETCAEGLPDGR